MAETLGLTALVGQGKQDRYSLSGLMWAGNTEKDALLTLTLNSRLQDIAQNQLKKGIKGATPPKYKGKRRAAVVMLNPTTGEILAAANYPSPKIGVHRWDYRAIEKYHGGANPYIFNPWQGDQADNTPGSTFKVVTAMAGLRAAEDDKSISTLLRGANLKNYNRVINLKPYSKTYQIRHTDIQVSTGHSIGASAGALFKGCGAHRYNKGRGVIGLQEVTKDSVNTWYAHLGILLDRRNIEDGQPTTLANMAEKLGFNATIPLDPFNLQRFKVERGDVLNAQSGKIVLPNGKTLNASLRGLAQNSFGQGLIASPLQMAKVAASIATGRNVQPQLLKSLGKKDAPINVAEKLAIPNLDWLRQGMQAVVQTGTAKGIFKAPQLNCHVYGKTGTADIGKKKEGVIKSVGKA